MSKDGYFKTEYLGTFPKQSEEYLLCYKYLIKYYYECERFDQFVCSGRDKDGAGMPFNGHERGLSNKFAINKIREIAELLKSHGICTNGETYNKAKQDANRLTLRGLEQEYNRLWQEGGITHVEPTGSTIDGLGAEENNRIRAQKMVKVAEKMENMRRPACLGPGDDIIEAYRRHCKWRDTHPPKQ